jgi:hypothetical protein
MLRAYCDESYDGQDRIYSLAGFVGRDRDWAKLSRNWRNRCLRDKIGCYHATDCEHRLKEFKDFTPQQTIDLNTDLTTHLTNARIAGFGISIWLEDYNAVAQSSAKAKAVLGPSPYFLGMQFLVFDICAELSEYGPSRVAFMFDQQEEFSGRAKIVYDAVREKNPSTASCMGTLKYADRRRFTPLQIADKLAYEIMKNMLNLKVELDGKAEQVIPR